MQPAPLTIPNGQASGRSTLTYGQPGTVTVEFFGGSPFPECKGDKKLAIQFIPPRTRLTLAAWSGPNCCDPPLRCGCRADRITSTRQCGSLAGTMR
jgi:hypothetical protein